MSERQTDFEWLRDFVRRGDQRAFADVVRRHLDLVYATALRKLEDDGAAEEVAQNVFAALAKKAWQFAPDDSLPAWLYRTTLLEAKEWLRGELRRRRREQTAAELGTTMKTPDDQTAFRALLPLLDEALLSLREKDRTALLLRFYESRSLRELGAALGVGEDAAQKRVAAALEKLAGFFQRRGYRTATVAAATAALQQTAISAPVGAVAVVAQAAMQTAPAWAGLTGLLSRFVSLTKLQTAAVCLALAIPPVAWQWNQTRATLKEAARLQSSLDDARAQREQLTADIARFRLESARLDDALAKAEQAQARAADGQRKLEALKARIRGLLTDSDYRWPDDLPCVRIPKSMVNKLYPQGLSKFEHSGNITDLALEMLAITPEEQLPTERALGDYWRGVEAMMAARAYETNLPNSQPGRIFKTVIVPPLGSELKALAQDTGRQIADQLGADRERILFGGWDEGAIQYFWPGNLWNISEDSQTFTMWVDPNASGTGGPTWGSSRTSKWGSTSLKGPYSLVDLSSKPIARQFFEPWLHQYGITNKTSISAE